MDLKHVRHLREVMITDAQGKTETRMQYSSQNVSHFRPNFVEVPFEDQEKAHELYVKLGGKRNQGMKIGMTVVIPANKSIEALLRPKALKSKRTPSPAGEDSQVSRVEYQT